LKILVLFVFGIRGALNSQYRSFPHDSSGMLARRRRHPHHFLGYPIGFLLVHVSRLVDGEFELKPGRRRCVDGDPAEIMREARLHEGAGGPIERLAGRAKDFVNDGIGFERTMAYG
jgi:hypothetical protein